MVHVVFSSLKTIVNGLEAPQKREPPVLEAYGG